MKKSQLRKIIKEEISKVLNEGWYDEEDTYYSGDYPDKGDEGLGEKIGWGNLRAQDYFEAGFKIAKKTNNEDAVKAWKEWREANVSDSFH